MPTVLHKSITPELMTRNERREVAFGMLSLQARESAHAFLLGWLSNAVSMEMYAEALRATLTHLDQHPTERRKF